MEILKILHIEDISSDAELVASELMNYFENLDIVLVSNKDEFVNELKSNSYDLILSAFDNQDFSGLEIYKEARKYNLDIPFVYVSKMIDLDLVKDILQNGVTDYVLKNNLAKLPFIIKRAIAASKDLILKEEAEVLFKESELFKTSVLNSVGSAIVVVDSDGTQIGSNRSWERFVRNNSGVFNPDQSFLEILKSVNADPGTIKSITDAIISITSNQLDYFYLDYNIQNNGVNKWYTLRINHFDHRPWVVISQINITLRKEIEGQIKESEKKYRELFEQMNEGLVVVSPTGEIQLANDSFASMLGYSVDEILGKSGTIFINDQKDLENFDVRLEQRSKGLNEKFEIKAKRKDSSTIWLNISSTPQYSSSGQYTGSMSLIEDITSKKESEIEREILNNIAIKASEEDIDLYDLCAFIQKELGMIMNSDNFFIAKQKYDRLEFLYISDHSEPEIDESRRVRIKGNGLSEYIIKSGKPILLKESEIISLSEKYSIVSYGKMAKCWMGVPIEIQGKTIGVMACQSYTNANEFDEEDLKFLSVLGSQIGLFLKKLQSETDKNKIFNLSRDLICIVKKDKSFSYVNPAFTRVLGYSRNDLINYKVEKIIHDKELLKELNNKFELLAHNTAIDEHIMKVKHKDLVTEKYIAWTASPDEDNESFFCIGRDITEQKIIQDHINESERQLREIFNKMNEGLLYTDKEGIITVVNPGLCKMLEYKVRELIGINAHKLLHSKEVAEKLKIKYKEREEGFSETYDLQFISKSGKTISTQISSSPDYNSKGEFIGVMSIISDISERKKQEEERLKLREDFAKELEEKVAERTKELEKAHVELAISLEKEKELGELKSRFVATASHQFRTPLSVIQSSIGILAMQKNGMKEDFIPKFERSYYKITEQISRMTNLMNDVLILGKINAGNISIRIKPISIVSLCENIVKSYKDIHSQRVINIKVEGEPRDINLDSALIEHALSNLVSNALKYSTDKSPVDLSILFDHESIQLYIKDYGIGIPQDSLGHLFEPFYRASNVREISGTGLGTAIAKEYIEINGGSIAVESELDKGTEFKIEFNNK